MRRACAATAVALALAACGSKDLPVSSRAGTAAPVSDPTADAGADAVDALLGTTPATDPGAESTADDDNSAAADGTVAPDDPAAPITIDAAAAGRPIDGRLLGTNLPAWLGPQRLSNADFVDETIASGATLLRMPGGSWSNSYDWRACEVGDAEGCYFPNAARPSDFVDFMQATGLPGSYTVSINRTPQSAAAAVAFFNGRVGDETVIGVDRDGFDWGTVDTWAQLRAEGGNPDPVPIELWEVGNEVYGGKPETGGADCAPFGWEDVWTCDGTEYVEGTADHDGYLAFRRAMLAVDPTIEVGAVGVPDPAGWNDWGNEVITAAGDQLDYYIVHQYGFDSSPAPDEALSRPPELWPAVVSGVRAALPDDTPIAVTEYNLVAVENRDTEQSMKKAMNALYLADSIGQMAANGVSIANQWDLAGGSAPSTGTNYGMIDVDDEPNLVRLPAFEALAMWGRAGSTLLPPTVTSGLRVYPTRHDDGRLTVIVVNPGEATSRTLELTGDIAGLDGAPVELTSVGAPDPTAAAMDPAATTQVGAVGTTLTIDLPAWSINAIEIGPVDG